MPRTKLTDPIVKKLTPPATGQLTMWDETLAGFGLRLAAGGARTWVVAYKVHGRKRWLTLGSYPLVSLADARNQAKQKLAKVTQGEDPAADRRAERDAVTFKDLAAL